MRTAADVNFRSIGLPARNRPLVARQLDLLQEPVNERRVAAALTVCDRLKPQG
ncbi:MAG: hypothetical protein M3075_13195 [Candidatus Dormibacteraeota bacterium]|nr:hypothetical protein [Candidatus Dormibacteraeota bacterium]